MPWAQRRISVTVIGSFNWPPPSGLPTHLSVSVVSSGSMFIWSTFSAISAIPPLWLNDKIRPSPADEPSSLRLAAWMFHRHRSRGRGRCFPVEVRQHITSHQFEGAHDVRMRDASGLLEADCLIQSGVVELLELANDLVGRAHH